MIVYKAVKGNAIAYLNPDKFEEMTNKGYKIYQSESLEDDDDDMLIMSERARVDVKELIGGMTHEIK